MHNENCYSGGNNKYLNFPANMNDGRAFSEWRPEAVVNNNIRKKNNINTNWNYRKYLQQNSNSIIEANQLLACDECSTCPYFTRGETYNQNNPFLYNSYVDFSHPNGYENSDLKTLYLSRNNLQARMIVPEATQDLLLSLKRAK